MSSSPPRRIPLSFIPPDAAPSPSRRPPPSVKQPPEAVHIFRITSGATRRSPSADEALHTEASIDMRTEDKASKEEAGSRKRNRKKKSPDSKSGKHMRADHIDSMLAWMEEKRHFNLLFGNGGNTKVNGMIKTKKQAFQLLAEHLKVTSGGELLMTSKQMRQRWNYLFRRFKEHLSEILDSDAGLAEDDREAGFRSLKEKLEQWGSHYGRMLELFGSRLRGNLGTISDWTGSGFKVGNFNLEDSEGQKESSVEAEAEDDSRMKDDREKAVDTPQNVRESGVYLDWHQEAHNCTPAERERGRGDGGVKVGEGNVFSEALEADVQMNRMKGRRKMQPALIGGSSKLKSSSVMALLGDSALKQTETYWSKQIEWEKEKWEREERRLAAEREEARKWKEREEARLVAAQAEDRRRWECEQKAKAEERRLHFVVRAAVEARLPMEEIRELLAMCLDKE